MCENSQISQGILYHNKIVTMIKAHVAVKLITSRAKILQIFLKCIYWQHSFYRIYIHVLHLKTGTEAEHSLIM